MKRFIDLVNQPKSIWVAVGVGWLALLALFIYLRFGFLPFLLGLRSIRLEKAQEALRLTALDAAPMNLWGALSLCVVPAFLMWELEAGIAIAAAWILLWPGFRVRVRVREDGTRVDRRFAYVIPWSSRLREEAPVSFVEGGEGRDEPEELHLGFVGDGWSIKLGRAGRSTAGRCEALAAEFNGAVRELRR